MNFVKHSFLITLFFYSLPAQSQAGTTDSIQVATTLKELFTICARVDFSDPKVLQLGTFYKAAPFIVYQGKDEKRKWKTIADYTKPEDKKGVDEVCFKINSTVNQDSSYRFIKYFTEKESEGTWHVMIVAYMKKGIEKQAAFALLKIKEKFALGDID